jgi:hypothetical protein
VRTADLTERMSLWSFGLNFSMKDRSSDSAVLALLGGLIIMASLPKRGCYSNGKPLSREGQRHGVSKKRRAGLKTRPALRVVLFLFPYYVRLT